MMSGFADYELLSYVQNKYKQCWARRLQEAKAFTGLIELIDEMNAYSSNSQ
jgi:hypothetical protein